MITREKLLSTLAECIRLDSPTGIHLAHQRATIGRFGFAAERRDQLEELFDGLIANQRDHLESLEELRESTLRRGRDVY